MEENIIIGYGILALHSLQNSANTEFKLKDINLEDFKNEIKTMIKVYPKEIAIQRSMDLLKYN